jgi:hypothetical protein
MHGGFISDLFYGLVMILYVIAQECFKNPLVTFLVTSLLFISFVTTYQLDKHPPAKPIHIECFSPAGETFTTDIGIEFKKTDYMEYHIVEYNGRETTFEGFCASRERE